MTFKAVTTHQPKELFDSEVHGFSQVCVTNIMGLRSITVSGQVGCGPDMKVETGLYAQTMKALDNLRVALECGGASLSDVSGLRIYFRRSELGAIQEITDALKAQFESAPPCATWLGVESLAREEFLVEIEPNAVFVSADGT